MSLVIPDNAPQFLAKHGKSGSLAAARAGVQHAFAVMSYKGKSWRLKYRGEDTLIRGPDNRPVQSLDVVIVGASSAISKIYYERQYVEGNEDGPDCYSLDGITPDAAAPRKQNGLCATCPHNQWGSRVTDAGKRAKNCQDNRRMAIVPLTDIANEACGGPMLLRLPPTSLINFANYAEFLERKGVGEIWWVATRLSFDPELAYPRIVFEAISYVDENQDALISEVRRSPQLERILLGTATPVTDLPDEPQPLAIPGTPPRRPAPAAQQVAPPAQQVAPPEEDEEPAEEEQEEQAPTPTPPPAPPAAAVSPFQRSTRKPAAPAAKATNGATNGAANGAAKTAAAKIAPTAPAPASDELEDAIGDLLDSPA